MSQKPPTNLITGFLKKYIIVVSGIFLIGCASSSDTNLWGKRFKVPQCPVVQLLKDTDIIIEISSVIYYAYFSSSILWKFLAILKPNASSASTSSLGVLPVVVK